MRPNGKISFIGGAVISFFVSWPPLSLAQTNNGEIGGIVRDESGGVIPGALVSVFHPATGFSTERVTDGGGRFFVSSLPVGKWDIEVTLKKKRCNSA